MLYNLLYQSKTWLVMVTQIIFIPNFLICVQFHAMRSQRSGHSRSEPNFSFFLSFDFQWSPTSNQIFHFSCHLASNGTQLQLVYSPSKLGEGLSNTNPIIFTPDCSPGCLSLGSTIVDQSLDIIILLVDQSI